MKRIIRGTRDLEEVNRLFSEHVTADTGDTRTSRRFSSAVQGHLRSLEKDEAKKCGIYIKAETAQLRMIDLNLFRVFDAMMLHRSVRKASQVLSVTPSAVSHALSRLRQSIGDELFIPTESGMQPTQRALQLASGVREGLEKLEWALTRKEAVPAETPRTFRIGATDYPCMVVLPSLVKRLAKSAPKVDLRVFPSNRIELVRQLEKGRADLVIGSFTELPAGISRTRLLREDEVITVRTGHPLTRGRMTKERLVEFPHVVVEPAEPRKMKPMDISTKEKRQTQSGLSGPCTNSKMAGKIRSVARPFACLTLPRSLLFSN